MRLKFLKRWRSFKADRLVDIADGAANVLIKRGFAVEFPVAPGVEPTAGIEIDVDAKPPPKPVPPKIATIRDDQTKVPNPRRKTKYNP